MSKLFVSTCSRPHRPLTMLKAGGTGRRAKRDFPSWIELFPTVNACFGLQAGQKSEEITPATEVLTEQRELMAKDGGQTSRTEMDLARSKKPEARW